MRAYATSEAGTAYGASRTFTTTGPIVVNIPNSTTKWEQGQSDVTITWDTGNLGEYVTIYLYKGSIQDKIISSSTNNDGSFSTWDVPTTQTPGTTYRVKIVYDATHYAYSDYFEIKEKTATAKIMFEVVEQGFIYSTNVPEWKNKSVYLTFSNQGWEYSNPEWDNYDGDILKLSPNFLTGKISFYFGLAAFTGLEVDASCNEVEVNINGCYAYWSTTTSGGFWTSTNYNSCPEYKFPLTGSTVYKSVTRKFSSYYVKTNQRTQISIGYDDTWPPLQAYAALKSWSITFIGWNIPVYSSMEKTGNVFISNENESEVSY